MRPHTTSSSTRPTGGSDTQPAPVTTPDVALGRLPRDWTTGFDHELLSRWPLTGSRERRAHDAADVLAVDTLCGWAATGRPVRRVSVLHDRHGGMSLPLLAAGLDVRVGLDDASAVRSLSANLEHFRDTDGALPAGWGRLRIGGVGADMLAGATEVVLALPRSLDELWLTGARIARHADDDVLVLGAGRDKHMSPSMNEVLLRCFETVVPGRGRSKSRVLTVLRPRSEVHEPEPQHRVHRVAGIGELTLVGGRATFGGASLDPGSRLLAETLVQRRAELPHSGARPVRTESGLQVHVPHERPEGAPDVIDLGSGNGTLAIVAARLWPRAHVLATDQSADAAASSAASVAANNLEERVRVRQADALTGLPEASVLAVVLNPPFHDGAAVDPAVADRLIADAARVLVPSGRLWCVVNSHLRHRALLERVVGPTTQLARNATFTVTESVRR